MKYTLLELVQRILGAMESDEVNDISETQEARDVVGIIKECYFDITGQNNYAEQEGLFKLEASTDNTKPVLMYVPDNVVKMDWLKYNYGTILHPRYSILQYLDPEEFVHIQSGMDPEDLEVHSFVENINDTDFRFLYRDNRTPTYYTILDEKYVIFDSYDKGIETTLTQIRSLGYGLLSPEFIEQNDFVPDLDHRQFQLLLSEAKATAFVELKQQENPKAERKARRNWILSQKTRNDNDPSETRQDTYLFGRTRRYGRVRYR